MEFHAEIEKTDKKEGWGGAREGAGRKAVPGKEPDARF